MNTESPVISRGPGFSPVFSVVIRRAVASVAVGIAAFSLYRATLLPGVDFGDTGSLQTTIGTTYVTPRDGYPLYFALGNLVFFLSRGEQAHALNLASAVEGAVACALIVLVASRAVGLHCRRRRRGAAVRRVVHVLESGGDRRGVRAPHRVRRAHTAAPPAMAARPDRSPPPRLLRRVRDRLRQPSVDDPARAGLHRVPAHDRAARLAIDVRAAYRRHGGGLRCRGRAAIRVEHPHLPAHAESAARGGRRGAALLVRRDEVRLARHDGHECSAPSAGGSLGDVLVRRAAAVRPRLAVRSRRRRGGARARPLAPRAARAPRVRRELHFRLQLQRRRHARLLPAGTPRPGAARRARDRGRTDARAVGRTADGGSRDRVRSRARLPRPARARSQRRRSAGRCAERLNRRHGRSPVDPAGRSELAGAERAVVPTRA